MQSLCDGFSIIDKLPEPGLPVKFPRTPGYRPKKENNKLNGWCWRVDIKGSKQGKLAGMTVGIKDNVGVAGAPMTVGCAALEGYYPEYDATVVTSILDAGGHIIGKTSCENLCVSGSSFTSHSGPTLNFHNPLHSAGGSSSGSATLVASGDVRLAIGSDQGGSVRLPAAWCGVVGLKPTFGLVPYTGVVGLEPSIDHVGTLTKTVEDCALLLEVVAGTDGLDHRQPPDLKIPEYSKEIQINDLTGMKIGIVKEGFAHDNADPKVNKMVRGAVTNLMRRGAIVEDVSIPLHSLAPVIWNAIGIEGFTDTALQYGGIGSGHYGFYPTSFTSFAAKSMRARMNDSSHVCKLIFMFGEYLKSKYPGQFYSKGQNCRRLLIAEYQEALKEYDVVAMPTIPFTAHKLPAQGLSVTEYVHKAFENPVNTMATNLTGMPSITVNAGFIDGLPVGAMFTAKKFDEVTLLKVAKVFEMMTQV
ncbi:amidase-like isoform X2 [Apostichopus japonicus]